MDRLRDCVRVAVIQDESGIAGFFPYERHSFGIGKPLGGFLTTCHGLISAPSLKVDARALLRACKLSVFDFDHLVAGQPTFAPYECDVRPAPVMDFTQGFDAWLEQVQDQLPQEPQDRALQGAQVRQGARWAALRMGLGRSRGAAHPARAGSPTSTAGRAGWTGSPSPGSSS